MNVGVLLTQTARRQPNRPAITDLGRTLTWQQLDARATALAASLRRIGLIPGDRVCVHLENSIGYIESLFAVLKAGLCIVPLNRKFTDDEVAFHMSDSQAAVLISDASGRPMLEHVSQGSFDFEEAATDRALTASRDVEMSVEDDAWLFYTSGTTGRPKGARLTHGNLAFMVASWLADLTPLGPNDVTMYACPLSHGAGFHALVSVARGCYQVFAPKGSFNPEKVLRAMREQRVTNAWLVPTQIIMLVDHLHGREPSLPDLRYVVYGGSPYPRVELESAIRTFGPRLVQLYGQGESPMTITWLPGSEHVASLEEGDDRLASVGYARPGIRVEVAGPDGNMLPSGEIGEVIVRGPTVMAGYWNRDDDSQGALLGGWLHTGDLGWLDSRGYLQLVGRAKEVIITGGSNVYPAEVEDQLRRHPGVHDIAVVGLQDRKWGETVAAAIVPNAEMEFVLDQLIQYGEQHLAKYKRPRSYRVLRELPYNANGKVMKSAVRELFLSDGSPEH